MIITNLLLLNQIGIPMSTNNQTKLIIKECEDKGLDPELVLRILQVPYEWTGDGFLFEFNSLSVEILSDYVNYIFRNKGYHLAEGTQINGIYVRIRYAHIDQIFKSYGSVYKTQVKIYSNEDKTYLETLKKFSGFFMFIDKLKYGKNYPNFELSQIADQISLLNPEIEGYLICDKCGSYATIKKEESPEDYDTNCECGGILKYIHINQIDEKLVEKYKKSNGKIYSNFPAIIIWLILSLGFFIIVFTDKTIGMELSVISFTLFLGLGFLIIRFKIFF